MSFAGLKACVDDARTYVRLILGNVTFKNVEMTMIKSQILRTSVEVNHPAFVEHGCSRPPFHGRGKRHASWHVAVWVRLGVYRDNIPCIISCATLYLHLHAALGCLLWGRRTKAVRAGGWVRRQHPHVLCGVVCRSGRRREDKSGLLMLSIAYHITQRHPGAL